MRLLPSTLFGRLLVSLLLAVGTTLLAMVLLIVQDRRDLNARAGGVTYSSHRIARLTRVLEALESEARDLERRRLSADPGLMLDPEIHERRVLPRHEVDVVERAFVAELHKRLGDNYSVAVHRASRQADDRIIRLFNDSGRSMTGLLDVTVKLPDRYMLTFRVLAPPPVPPLPWQLFRLLGALTIVLVVILFVVTRNITRPLSNLARAADAAGRSVRLPPVPEQGVSEIREATRAFNTMQDRLLRYLDSRTGVLAAMSHDLRTPLTRLRLRVESVADPQLRARFRTDLDEMEGLVRSALALFKGVADDEAYEQVDVNVLLETLVAEYVEIGSEVSIAGSARDTTSAKPRALKRCLTNLVDNALTFGQRALIRVDDGEALVITVSDDGPGIPEESLEKVFEPFHRLESSRSRDSGGTGLGLSIARDIAQAHGATLTLRNRPEGGLTAELCLPRKCAAP
jgi:signal transduction histidine kinase